LGDIQMPRGDDGQQKLEIKGRIDMLKKAARELNEVVSALEKGFLAGTVSDTYMPNEMYLHEQNNRDAILAFSVRALFRPILYGTTGIELRTVDLLFDLFPADLAYKNMDLVGDKKRFYEKYRDKKGSGVRVPL
jgi:hypothetical protein